MPRHDALVCRACGAGAARWSGQCARCGAWNTLGPPETGPEPIALADAASATAAAVPTGVAEFDRALGGGLVPGSVTLVGGEPGIGKSTLSLQLAGALSRAGRVALICSAEESVGQVAARAQRIGADTRHIGIVQTFSSPDIVRLARREQPELLVVDSVQTVADPEVGGQSGSVAQVREAAAALVDLAKRGGPAVLLVGHVTKDGALAGPRRLEHLVDTVLSFEGDRHHAVRVLAVTKHRFGAAGELGIFEMGPQGLAGVADPSALLLADRAHHAAGSVVVPVLEGRRPLLVELQALATTSSYATPRRAAEGVAAGRLALILAVLEQHAGVPFGALDVFASAVGGVSVHEPGADLGLALALASAVAGVALDPTTVAVGEVGLVGELRRVVHAERRLAEAARFGFRRAIVPGAPPPSPPGLEVVSARSLVEALAAAGLGGGGPRPGIGPKTGTLEPRNSHLAGCELR